MLYRKAERSDISEITKIYDNIHTAEENGKATGGWVRGVYPVKSTAEDALARDDLFVAEYNGSIVGTSIINQIQPEAYRSGKWEHRVSDSEIMVLHTLVIDPHYSGQAYGKGFVRFYEDYTLSEGCRYLRLDTQEKNQNARVMYKKLGYTERGVVPCEFNGIQDVRLVLLEKEAAV